MRAWIRNGIVFAVVTGLISTFFMEYNRVMERKVNTLVKNCKLGPGTINHDNQKLFHPCFKNVTMRSPLGIPEYSAKHCVDTKNKAAVAEMKKMLCAFGIYSKRSSMRTVLGCWHEGDPKFNPPACLKEYCRFVRHGSNMNHEPVYAVRCGYEYKPPKKKTKKVRN